MLALLPFSKHGKHPDRNTWVHIQRAHTACRLSLSGVDDRALNLRFENSAEISVGGREGLQLCRRSTDRHSITSEHFGYVIEDRAQYSTRIHTKDRHTTRQLTAMIRAASTTSLLLLATCTVPATAFFHGFAAGGQHKAAGVFVSSDNRCSLKVAQSPYGRRPTGSCAAAEVLAGSRRRNSVKVLNRVVWVVALGMRAFFKGRGIVSSLLVV